MDIETYVRENPEVWSAFTRFTIEAATKGRTRLSARLVIERMRWESMISESGSAYKINNDIAPKLARRFMAHYPGMDGFFRTRG
jgi:hypothetical protein